MASLWKIPDVTNMKTPLTIIREQATELSEATRGLLKGKVDSSQSGGLIDVKLSIIVPALNNYKYNILNYTQPITLYPGRLYFNAENVHIVIENEKEFITELEKILQSTFVVDVLRSLLAQAQDEEVPF